MYIKAPASVAQGTSWKKGQKDCKRQNTRKSALKVSPKNDYTNKTRTKAISLKEEEDKELRATNDY